MPKIADLIVEAVLTFCCMQRNVNVCSITQALSIPNSGQ